MKKLFVLILVCAATVLSAQKSNYKNDITTSLLNYSSLLEKGDVDTALGFMYPKFFDVFPRTMIAESMEKAFNDTMVGFTFGKINISAISKPLLDNGIQYVLVDYTMDTKMHYKKPLADNETQEKDAFEMALNMLSMTYGEGNVTGDFATRSYLIKMDNHMFAINDPKYGNKWWFIEKKDELKTLVADKVLPAKVWDSFKPKKKKAKKGKKK